MRKELSSLDLHFLVREFQELVNAKIDKLFQDREFFLFQLHLISKGKMYLKIILPGFIFISESKENVLETENFSLALRKHITDAKIISISQREFERILEIELAAKGRKYKLFAELFRPGNVILCDENETILLAKEYKGFGS